MVFVLAEIGMNHDGSFGQAKALIKAAAECGADAVKFQTHIADAETLPDAPPPKYFSDEPRHAYFKRTSFSLEQYRILKKYAEECRAEFISSPFSIEAVDILEEIGISTYKVPSGEVSNVPYLIRVANTCKKVLLSSGMSTWKELDEAIRTLRANGCHDIVLMQCTSEYPCPPEHAGLNVMLEMRERYKLPVGFSDHTSGIAVSIAAAVLGASVIEKHFTLSKKMYGPDAKNSAIPEEFKALLEGVRAVEKALLKIDKDAEAESLKDMKMVFEKSIVAACDIHAGTILEEKHLSYKKPGDGIPARDFKRLIGKKIINDVKYNHKFSFKDFEKI